MPLVQRPMCTGVPSRHCKHKLLQDEPNEATGEYGAPLADAIDTGAVLLTVAEPAARCVPGAVGSTVPVGFADIGEVTADADASGGVSTGCAGAAESKDLCEVSTTAGVISLAASPSIVSIGAVEPI